MFGSSVGSVFANAPVISCTLLFTVTELMSGGQATTGGVLSSAVTVPQHVVKFTPAAASGWKEKLSIVTMPGPKVPSSDSTPMISTSPACTSAVTVPEPAACPSVLARIVIVPLEFTSAMNAS